MENSLSGFIHLMSLNSLQNIYWIDDVESTNSMSQEIGPVMLCHTMSLVVTLTKDCAPPLQGRNEMLHWEGMKYPQARNEMLHWDSMKYLVGYMKYPAGRNENLHWGSMK